MKVEHYTKPAAQPKEDKWERLAAVAKNLMPGESVRIRDLGMPYSVEHILEQLRGKGVEGVSVQYGDNARSPESWILTRPEA